MNLILEQDLEHIHNNILNKNKFDNSTILITGAAGFLGYEMLNYLVKYSDELNLKKIIALDNFLLDKVKWATELSHDCPLLEFKKFDIVLDDLNSIISDLEVDYVIHMASIASPTFYRKFPIETLDANIWGLRKLLDYFINRKISGFLFFSSSEIYGDPDQKNIPTEEGYNGNVSCTGPRACYDEAKRFGETLCMKFYEKYNLPIGIARPFNNYGPGMNINDKRAPADFANCILNNKEIEILSDGNPTRTFCYVADAIAGYFNILLDGHGDFFNIGIEKPEISIKNLAQLFVDAGKRLGIYKHSDIIYLKSTDPNYLIDNPNRRCPNISKAKKILSYNPSITVENGIERYLKFLNTKKL